MFVVATRATDISKDVAKYSYANPGTYVIKVTAQNRVGNTTKIYVIKIENPVTEHFAFESNTPATFSPTGKL